MPLRARMHAAASVVSIRTPPEGGVMLTGATSIAANSTFQSAPLPKEG